MRVRPALFRLLLATAAAPPLSPLPAVPPSSVPPAAEASSSPSATSSATTATAGDWLAQLDPGVPGPVPPPRPFQAMYRMHWGKVEGARAEVDFRLGPDPGEAQTRVDAHTQGWARTLFQMDAVHLSVVHLDGLRPVRAEQTESRTKRREVYRLDFPDGPGTAVRHHRKAEPPGAPEVPDPEDKRFAYPTLRDMTTAFLYLRSQPLEKDEPHVFVIMSAKTPYLARVRVVGREPIAVNAAVGHPQPAIELDVGLQKIDREGRLKPHKFFKSARVWLSDDADRVILRAESQIFIGRVSMELEKFGH